MARHLSRSYRKRKAYWTTFVVLCSYGKLYVLDKVLGRRYYQKRIGACHLRNAHRVKNTILQLKGLFIKIGQLLSILTNFLPEAFHGPLEGLQDQIPPRPFSEIKVRFNQEFGKSPIEVFSSFQEEPIASASIGQVHRATLKEGTAVVVKVQHADIEKIAEVDLEIMRRLVKLVQWMFGIKGIEHAYLQVRQMIEEELDFEKEAASMKAIKLNLSNQRHFIIPEVHEDYSTGRVLTTTYYEGVKISQVDQLDDWEIDRLEIGNRLVKAYCEMVFVHGFYHADPHPGNVLIQENGTIVLLDFGAVATLQPEMRKGFLNLIEATAKNDRPKIIHALKDLGFIANEKQAEKITGKIIDGLRHFLQNEVQFDGLNFKDIKVNPFESSLYNLTNEIGLKELMKTIQVPKDYVLLNRMVSLLLGICNTLDSQMNPLKTVRPYFQKFMLGEKGDLTEWVINFVRKNISALLTLPVELGRALNKLNQGEIEIRDTGQRQKLLFHFALAQQFFFLFIGISTFGLFFALDLVLESWTSRLVIGFGVIAILNSIRWSIKAKRIAKSD